MTIYTKTIRVAVTFADNIYRVFKRLSDPSELKHIFTVAFPIDGKFDDLDVEITHASKNKIEGVIHNPPIKNLYFQINLQVNDARHTLTVFYLAYDQITFLGRSTADFKHEFGKYDWDLPTSIIDSFSSKLLGLMQVEFKFHLQGLVKKEQICDSVFQILYGGQGIKHDKLKLITNYIKCTKYYSTDNCTHGHLRCLTNSYPGEKQRVIITMENLSSLDSIQCNFSYADKRDR